MLQKHNLAKQYKQIKTQLMTKELNNSYHYIKKLGSRNKSALCVGTVKHRSCEAVREEAQKERRIFVGKLLEKAFKKAEKRNDDNINMDLGRQEVRFVCGLQNQ